MKVTLITVCASFSMLSLQGCGNIGTTGNPVPVVMVGQQYAVQHAFLQSNVPSQPLCQAASRSNGVVAPNSEITATSAAENAPEVVTGVAAKAELQTESAVADDTHTAKDFGEILLSGVIRLAEVCITSGNC